MQYWPAIGPCTCGAMGNSQKPLKVLKTTHENIKLAELSAATIAFFTCLKSIETSSDRSGKDYP